MKSVEKLLPFIPLLVLVGIAATQIYLAEARELTPWKGGGFGMFSTLDGRDNRHLIVNVIERRGGNESKLPAEVPKTRKIAQLANKARAMPTSERLQLLADELALQSWRIGEKVEERAVNRARVIEDKVKQLQTRRIKADRVEVSLWKLRYAPHDGAVVLPRSEMVRTVAASTSGAQRAGGAR